MFDKVLRRPAGWLLERGEGKRKKGAVRHQDQAIDFCRQLSRKKEMGKLQRSAAELLVGERDPALPLFKVFARHRGVPGKHRLLVGMYRAGKHTARRQGERLHAARRKPPQIVLLPASPVLQQRGVVVQNAVGEVRERNSLMPANAAAVML